jgi:hypothetical protein
MIVLLKLLKTWTIAHLSPAGDGDAVVVAAGVVVSLLNLVSSSDLVHRHLAA